MTLRTHNRTIYSLAILIGAIAVVLFSTGTTASAQQSTAVLEQRVAALEDYVATIQPTLVELSDNLNRSIQQYTNDLENSLEVYSRNLQRNLDQRLDGTNRRAVILDPFSKAYQAVETNTGTFLIAIERIEHIESGVRLHVNIGNPNYADYQNFQLKFIWGPKRGADPAIPYDEWRQSLNGLEFSFQGKIEKGKWNTTTVDLRPLAQGQLGYLECEMSVASVELGIGPN